MEDKFMVVAIRAAPRLCPPHETATVIALALEQARSFLGDIVPVFDLRGLQDYYNDVAEFVAGFGDSGGHILVGDDDLQRVRYWGLERKGFTILNVRGDALSAKSLDLKSFYGEKSLEGDFSETLGGAGDDLLSLLVGRQREEGWFGEEGDEEAAFLDDPLLQVISELDRDKLSVTALKRVFDLNTLTDLIASYLGAKPAVHLSARNIAQSFTEFLPLVSSSLRNVSRGEFFDRMELSNDLTQYVRSSFLHAFLKKLHRRSLLVEYVIAGHRDEIVCVPFHSHAIHNIEHPHKSELIVGRPGVIANSTAAILSGELIEFQRLINAVSTRERHIQAFLEAHPSFLRGLNYRNIYPQLVLQRDNESSLIPDFILEPFDDAWCDILDVKLPRQKLIIGRNDRATLAAGVHEVVAQLREYSAYFEQEKYRKFVREKFGLKVYRPRLVALVGRDMWQMASEEVRRAMTAYDNLEVMTFDAFIEHCKSRILV
jgi:hypothetical protein